MTIRWSRWIPLLLGVLGLSASQAWAQTTVAQAVPAFDLSVRVDVAEPGLDVQGQVSIPARSVEIASIELQLDRRVRDFEISVVSPLAAAGPATVTTRGNGVLVTFAMPAPAGSPVTLRFRHRIGSNSSRSFYIARDGALISGESYRWYPLPANNRRATGRMRFLVPDGFTIAATGRRAGARDVDGWVRFDVTDPTTFSFAAARHEVYTSPGEPAIALHLLRPRSGAADRLALIRRILTVLVDEFGPYPHPDLEIVEMPTAAMGGTENGTSLEGFVVVGTDIIERASLPTLAHEIGHQWWADCVFAVGPSTVLLTEAMVNYGALRAVAEIRGERAAAESRWRGYPGDSLFAGGRGYLSLVRAGLDAPLTSATVEPMVGGGKGQLVLDLLSRTMGRDRFSAVLRTFVRDHAFQDTTWQAFVDAVHVADPDIGWFFDQWYARPGVPSWTVSWTQSGGEIRGVVTQTAPYYRADVDVAVQGSQAHELHPLRIDGPRTEFTWPASFPVLAVRIDPDYKVPHSQADRTADVDALAPLGVAVTTMRSGSSFNAAAVAALNDAPPHPSRDFLREAILGWDALERGEWDRARSHIDAALASRAPLPELLPGLYYTQAVVARMRGDRATVERAARSANDADSMLVAPSGWGFAALELLDEVGAGR